jgi:hypothetical protein
MQRFFYYALKAMASNATFPFSPITFQFIATNIKI